MSLVFTLSFVALLATVVSGLFWRWYKKTPQSTHAKVKVIRNAAISFGSLWAISLFASLIVTVPTSSVGVPTSFGKVMDTVLYEGLHLVPPWWKVNNVYTGVDQAAAKGTAGTSDTQTVSTEISLRYSVDSANARALFILNPTLNYETMVVEPMSKDAFKFATAQYKAEELMKNRDLVRDKMLTNLRSSLKRYGIVVHDIAVTDFDFSKGFKDSVEAKVIAVQNAQAAANDLERVKYEAAQVRERAKAEAEAIELKSKALASSTGALFIQQKAIDKWNGVLPIVSGGSSNLIDVSKIIPQQPAK